MIDRKTEYKESVSLHLKFNKVRGILFAAGIFILFSIVSYFISIQLDSIYDKNAEIRVQKQYINFQNDLNTLIESSKNLIVGYEAFYLSSEEITPDENETFLYYLSKDYSDYVRNIGIIEDTTIVYNYPYEENKSTIGVDLAQVEGQKEAILKVKNELVETFQGPIDLIQGGTGYIIRIPILNKDGTYWGQASIVLRADVLNEKILEYAANSDLTIAIFNGDDLQDPILGDSSIIEKGAYLFTDENSGWNIYAISSDTEDNWHLKWIIFIVGLIISLGISLFYLSAKWSHYRLRYTMLHDQLTDLYNRHYLEIVQEQITKNSEKDKTSFGLMHIDLDNFKYINDHYGHNQGDEVLREISRILKKVSRRNELVFRIGGDEFLIVISKVRNLTEMNYMRKRYLTDFSTELENFEYKDIIGVSIGIGMMYQDEDDFDSVLKAADLDMYEQKKKNKQTKEAEEFRD